MRIYGDINLERTTRSHGPATQYELPSRTRKKKEPKVSSPSATSPRIDTLTINTSDNNPQIMATNTSDSAAIDQLNTAIDARVAEQLAQMAEKLQATLEQERREMEAQFERRLERELQARLNAMSVSNDPSRNEGAQAAPHTFEQVTQAIVALRAQDPNLRKPEPFSAPSQITNTKVFLCDYEHYIRTAYPGDEGACARYLSTYLTGKARQWYDRTIRNSANRDNYQIVKEGMIKHFAAQERLARIQGINKQGSTESVEAYATYLSDIIQVRGLNEEAAIEKLIEGLKPTIAKMVLVQNPQTYEAAVTLAKTAEASQSGIAADTGDISAIIANTCRAIANKTEDRLKEINTKLDAIAKPSNENVEALNFNTPGRGYDQRRDQGNLRGRNSQGSNFGYRDNTGGYYGNNRSSGRWNNRPHRGNIQGRGRGHGGYQGYYGNQQQYHNTYQGYQQQQQPNQGRSYYQTSDDYNGTRSTRIQDQQAMIREFTQFLESRNQGN